MRVRGSCCMRRRELSPSFRLDYCHLWVALLERDDARIREYCGRMGAGDMYRVLTTMLTSRSYDQFRSDRTH